MARGFTCAQSATMLSQVGELPLRKLQNSSTWLTNSACRSQSSQSNGTPGFGEPIELRRRDSNWIFGFKKPWKRRNLSGKTGPSTSDLSRIERSAMWIEPARR